MGARLVHKLFPAAAAVITLTAGDGSGHHDAIADLEPFGSATDLLDEASELVSHRQRSLDPGIAVVKALQIGAAYGAGIDLHQQFSVATIGLGNFLDANVARRVVDDGSHD